MYAIVEDNNITQYINNPKSVVIGDEPREKLFFNQARAERYKVGTFKYIKKHLSENQINKIFFIMDAFLKNKNQLVMDAKFIKAKNHHQL